MSATGSLRSSAASGVFWSALQIWLVRLTTAAAFIVLSRQLQPSEFGLIALAMSVISVLSILSDTGLATYVIRVPEISRRLLSTAFWTTLLLSLVLTAVLAVVALPLASAFDEPDLAPVLWWLSAGLVLTGLNSVPSALLRRDLKFKQFAVRGLVATFIGSAVAIVLALNGAGVWALVAQSLVRGVVGLVIVWSAVRWFPSFSWDARLARTMLSFGSKLLGIDLMMQVQARGQDFILAGLSGTASLGSWSVANRLLRIIQETGASVISSVATPAFSKMQGDRRRLYRAYEVALSTSGAAMFPVLLFLAVTSPQLVPLLLGEQWVATAQVAQVLAVTAVLEAFNYFDRPVFVALDKLKPELLLVGSSVVLHVAVVVIFAPMGLMPLALALLGRALLVVPVRFLTLHRYAGVPYGVMVRPFRVLLAAVAMAAIGWAVYAWVGTSASGWWQIAAAAVACLLAYPVALWLLARQTVRELQADLSRVRSRRPAPPVSVDVTEDPLDGPVAPAATALTDDPPPVKAQR